MRMEFSQIIHCTPARLWPWLDDAERSKQWLRGLEEVEAITPGPKRPGYETLLRIREGRKLSEYKRTLLEYEPERRFVMKVEGGCMRGVVLHEEYRLADLGDGSTRLDYTFSAEMKGWMRIFGPLFALFGRMQTKSFFKKLKALAEGEHAVGATT
ncbi:MAG: SRPBCC family protein [Planctomycetes bacterium]|nr:SRPBCC family protein [Planctomycetota bacterium]